MANTALFMGRFQEAIPNYKQAARYMQLIGSLRNVAAVNQNLGYIYSKQKMYPQALDYYRRALAIDTAWTQDKADRRSIASDYFNMGVVFSDQGKRKETMDYYRRAKGWIDPKNDLDFMINLYNNIGFEHGLDQRYDSALYYRNEALRYSRQLGNSRHELHILMTMAQTRSQMQQYAAAKNYWMNRTLLRKKIKSA